jgi:outer membrane protein TolC
VTHPLLKGVGLDVNLAPLRQARLAQAAARWALRARARAVVRDLLKAYLDVVAAQAALRVQLGALEQARRDLARARALIAAGRLPLAEQVAHRLAVAQQSRLVLERRTAWLQSSLVLRSQTGQAIQPGRPLVRARLPISPWGSTLPAAAAVARAAARESAELAAALRELRIRQIDVVTARRGTWPSLDLSASVGPQGRSDRVGRAHGELFRFRSLGWSVGLTFSYLIGNRAAKARLQQAHLAQRRSRLAVSEIRQTLVAEATRLQALLILESRLARTARQEVALADQRLGHEQKKYARGRSSTYLLLQMRQELTQARHKAFAARVTALKRRVELAALMGDLLPRLGLARRPGLGGPGSPRGAPGPRGSTGSK